MKAIWLSFFGVSLVLIVIFYYDMPSVDDALKSHGHTVSSVNADSHAQAPSHSNDGKAHSHDNVLLSTNNTMASTMEQQVVAHDDAAFCSEGDHHDCRFDPNSDFISLFFSSSGYFKVPAITTFMAAENYAELLLNIDGNSTDSSLLLIKDKMSLSIDELKEEFVLHYDGVYCGSGICATQLNTTTMGMNDVDDFLSTFQAQEIGNSFVIPLVDSQGDNYAYRIVTFPGNTAGVLQNMP